MKKTLIDVYFPKSTNGKRKYVATSKACDDVTTILTSKGFDRQIIYRSSENSVLGTIELLVKLVFCLLRKRKGSIVVVQYPMMNILPFSFCSFLFKRLNSIAVVHDIRSYCHLSKYRKKELKILNCFDTLIVHNETMLKQLQADGVKSKMVTLGCFDYLLDKDMNIKKIEKNSIIFAGNLNKSLFLKQLHQLNFNNIKFNLYGGQKPEIIYNQFIEYKGRFAPSDISSIEGEWGLVWEGESLETCNGVDGEYLTLIAPHKFSLYLACGLKIICWEQSAMASMVKEYKLGFTINNLHEIEDRILSFSQIELDQMSKNIKLISNNLRGGLMLKNAIEHVLP